MFFKLVSITQFRVIPPTYPFWHNGSHIFHHPRPDSPTAITPVFDLNIINLQDYHLFTFLFVLLLFLPQFSLGDSESFKRSSIRMSDGTPRSSWASSIFDLKNSEMDELLPRLLEHIPNTEQDEINTDTRRNNRNHYLYRLYPPLEDVSYDWWDRVPENCVLPKIVSRNLFSISMTGARP